MVEILQQAALKQKTVIILTEERGGAIQQRRVMPRSVNQMILEAYCVSSKMEIAINMPSLIGIRYWLDSDNE